MPMGRTVLSSWVKAIRRTLDARGIDSLALCAQAGLDLTALDDPNARYPVARTTRLWELAVKASGDPALGLAVASNVGPTTFHALSYSIMASASLGDMLERVARYFRIATDVSTLEYRPGADECLLVVYTPSDQEQPASESVDAFTSLLIRTARSLVGRELNPLWVSLRHPAPADTSCYQRVWRAPLTFNAERDVIAFSREDCERPLDTANAELARRNDEIISHYLQQLDQATLSGQVRDQLIKSLPHGEPSAEQLAATLNMSLRSLQRHLADAGTSFEQILLQVRQQLAGSYLADPRYAIGEIAFLLGYADASCFSRAFRRWHGQSPRAFRSASGTAGL